MSTERVHFREQQRFRQRWLWIVAIPIFLLVPLTVLANLRTEVKGDALLVQFWPFHLKERRIPVSTLASYKARTYQPIREYGGWGLRHGRSGQALNMSGDRGVQLSFTNGTRLLLGSQHPEELERAIASAREAKGAADPDATIFREVQYSWEGSGAWVSALTLIVALGVGALLFGATMLTEVHADAVTVQFTPFHRKPRRFAFTEIESFEPRTYRPIRDYGGWGIRGLGKKRAYNVSGDRGVLLTMKDGRSIMLGSQKADELAAAIADAKGLAEKG